MARDREVQRRNQAWADGQPRRDPELGPSDAQIDAMLDQPAPEGFDRHMRRLLQLLFVEQRATRQYVQWIHEMLANHEIGQEAGLPSVDEIKTKARATARTEKRDQRKLVREMLERRAAMGIGNGGLDLTPEEEARIQGGEDPQDVLAGV